MLTLVPPPGLVLLGFGTSVTVTSTVHSLSLYGTENRRETVDPDWVRSSFGLLIQTFLRNRILDLISSLPTPYLGSRLSVYYPGRRVIGVPNL